MPSTIARPYYIVFPGECIHIVKKLSGKSGLNVDKIVIALKKPPGKRPAALH